MDLAGRIRRLRLAVRRRERLAVAVYLAVTAAALAFTCAPALRDPVLDRIEWWTVRAGERWPLRVEAAEDALGAALAEPDPLRREARLEEVVTRLDGLERVHPATRVKHARDTERVRLLRARVEAERALGRKGRALDAARRLVAFDPRRYESHLLHADTAMAFAEDDEAARAYAAVLAIHPGHLPSVQAVVELAAEGADWAAATAAFERYLDALHLEPVEARLDGRSVGRVRVPADGRWHAVDVPVPGADGRGAPDLVSGLAMEVRELRAARALTAGAPPAASAPVARVRAQVRLRKPAPTDLWEVVERAYRNQLREEDRDAARARIALVPEEAP
jgi:hypothetical protein